jgi:hypothetical protein
MNYERRKMRPQQPAMPSPPPHKGMMGSGSAAGVSMKGTVGSGSPPADNCKGAMGQHGSKKGY